MWPKKSIKKVAVSWNGVRISLDMELPIIKSGVIELLQAHPQLVLSRTKEGVLSVDQLTRDIAARQQQVSLLKDADAATRYGASRAEIERTAKLLAIQARAFSEQAPVIFVGNGDEANAIDFGLTAALAVAQKGDGEISYQAKALIGIALECAESEAQAAKAMLEMGQLGSKPQPKTKGFKLTQLEPPQSPDVKDPTPWKAKRIAFDPKKPFTTQEYIAHMRATYSAFGDESLTGIDDPVVAKRLHAYAHYFRNPESNVVSLHKSDLDGADIWTVIRKFSDEFFPAGSEPNNTIRVSAILGALLDAEDLHEEDGGQLAKNKDLPFIYQLLMVASQLLSEEVAEQASKKREEVAVALNSPVVVPLIKRPKNRDPDAN